MRIDYRRGWWSGLQREVYSIHGCNQSINQSSLRLLKKTPLLTQTQEGCTIEFKTRKTKYASLQTKKNMNSRPTTINYIGTNSWRDRAPHVILSIQSYCCP